jgi:hypothetical protein
MHMNNHYNLKQSKERHDNHIMRNQFMLKKPKMFSSLCSLENLISSSGLVTISTSWSSMPTF